MRSRQEISNRLEQYSGANLIYTDFGYIAWQVSTGENVELLFIETKEQRRGYGKKLVQLMCQSINPFNSVFVFRLKENENAGKFYRSLGFKEYNIEGLYKTRAVLGVVSYKKLCQNLSIN